MVRELYEDWRKVQDEISEAITRDRLGDKDVYSESEIYKSVEMCAEQVEYAICRALGLDYRGRFFVPQEEPKSS